MKIEFFPDNYAYDKTKYKLVRISSCDEDTWYKSKDIGNVYLTSVKVNTILRYKIYNVLRLRDGKIEIQGRGLRDHNVTEVVDNFFSDNLFED